MNDRKEIINNMKAALSSVVDEIGQAETAKLIHVSQPAISKVLNPNSTPKIDTLFKWLTKLGFEIQFKIKSTEI